MESSLSQSLRRSALEMLASGLPLIGRLVLSQAWPMWVCTFRICYACCCGPAEPSCHHPGTWARSERRLSLGVFTAFKLPIKDLVVLLSSSLARRPPAPCLAGWGKGTDCHPTVQRLVDMAWKGGPRPQPLMDPRWVPLPVPSQASGATLVGKNSRKN